MKKGLEKFVSILLLVLGVILIVFLALAVFGQLDDATMKNEVVRTMILGLAFVFLICSIVMIAASFKDNDVLKAVVLSSERASTTRVSLSVIKKIVAKNAKYISGLKVSGVALQLDENNAIRMKLTVKISENDVDFVVDCFRCLLYDAFYATLGVEFASIDFKVKALSPKYAPDMNKVDRAAAEIKEKREKLMLQKLKMEEEEAKYEEERKLEAEKRRREEARLRREREEERKRERLQMEKEQFGDLGDAEEVPVYVIDDNFDMANKIAESSSEQSTGTTDSTEQTGNKSESAVNFESTVFDSESVAKEEIPTESNTDAPAQTESETADGEIEENVVVSEESSEKVSDKNDEALRNTEEDNNYAAEVENISGDSVADSVQSLDESAREAYAETEPAEHAGDDDCEAENFASDGGVAISGSEERESENDSETSEGFLENGDDENNKTEE